MKHAFIMSVHTNVEQIKLLVSTLSFADVYIHVDRKSTDLYDALVCEYKRTNNVVIIENRVSVNWSGLSQVRATLNLLSSVHDSKNKYDYIHYISGQDMLLMKQSELDEFILSRGDKSEFIQVRDIGQYSWRLLTYSFFRENPNNRKLLYRLTDIFLRLIQKLFIKRKNFDGIDLYMGSSWFSITSTFLKFIQETIDETYISKFKYTACPDEHFFQILAMNSEFKDRVNKENFRYLEFEKNKNSPKVLTLDDYDEFMNGDYLFARKFDILKDRQVVYKIQEKFLKR